MDLQNELGLTFIIVTHDQEEAMTLADRIAIMDHGRIVQVDTPSDIYENPNSRHVAEFVGEVNLLEGVVNGHLDNITSVESLQAGLLHIENDILKLRAGDRVHVALRPEKLQWLLIRLHHSRQMPCKEKYGYRLPWRFFNLPYSHI